MENTNQIKDKKQSSASSVNEVLFVGLFGSIIFILGTMLPYASLGIFDIALLDGGIGSIAGLFILIGVLGLAASIIRKPLIILIVGLLAVILTVIEFLTFQNNSAGSSFFGYSLSDLIEYGIGFYFLWLGAGVILITGLYGIYKKQKTN